MLLCTRRRSISEQRDWRRLQRRLNQPTRTKAQAKEEVDSITKVVLVAAAEVEMVRVVEATRVVEVASLAHDVDLLLQRVQIQQWPDRARSTECPPSQARTTGFACLGPLFLLPSIPAFLSAVFR